MQEAVPSLQPSALLHAKGQERRKEKQPLHLTKLPPHTNPPSKAQWRMETSCRPPQEQKNTNKHRHQSQHETLSYTAKPAPGMGPGYCLLTQSCKGLALLSTCYEDSPGSESRLQQRALDQVYSRREALCRDRQLRGLESWHREELDIGQGPSLLKGTGGRQARLTVSIPRMANS